MITYKKWILPALIFCLAFFNLQAQNDKELLAKLAEEERETVNALVLYPKEVRSTLMEASLYPELLVKIDRIQQFTSQHFQELLADYPQETQQLVWDLTRYPGLIPALTQEPKSEKKDWSNLLKDFPEVIHSRAEEAYEKHFDLLSQIDSFNKSTDLAFKDLMAPYPPEVEVTFKELLEIPEVLSILTDNIQLTVLVGDIYKKDPQWVISKTDSMSLEVAKVNAKELENWKKELENDPQAMEELQASAEEFSEEYGYDDMYYDYDVAEEGYDEAEPEVRVYHHYYHHYPYWFGYPSWYVYPRWRPYPVWWDWGFYYQPGRVTVIIGLPSFYFSNWYFHHPHHHHHYPHLSNHYVNHYYGHRSSSSSVVASVDRWQRVNSRVITKEWLKNDKGRVDRFKEFGKFESERQAYNTKNTKSLNQREFLSKKSEKYSDLKKYQPKQSPKVKAPKSDPTRTKVQPKVDRKPTRPKIDPTKKKTKKTKVYIPRPSTDKKPTTRKYKIDKGTDLHKRSWEKRTPETKTRVLKQSPKVKKMPSKSKIQKTIKSKN